MQWVKPFKEIGKHDAAIAGGKGASLGEMTQAGIPVPPGFVVTANAFEHFVTDTKLDAEIAAILGSVDPNTTDSVEAASAKIQGLIMSGAHPMPADVEEEIRTSFGQLGAEFVAVRSSATAEDSAAAAWAGQLDTYLNTTADTLLMNVKRCWASLFTPRAVFYRFEKNLHGTKISVAVVVQKMVNSDSAGVAFSVDPVTQDRNQMILEGAFGLGEAVVSGHITPDSFVVSKEPRAIVDKTIVTKDRGLFRKQGGGNEWRDIPSPEADAPAISDSTLLAVADTVAGIEKHYGFPVDVEWAVEKGTLYVLQSRPITTLSA